jgi:uncharacterized RDD family membrane protein YckC
MPPPPPGGWAPAPVGDGFYLDPNANIVLPNGVGLASHGRRIGAYFLAIPLAIVTLGIGYVIWGLIVWGKGTSPALQVLGMKVYRPEQRQVGTFGTMALRNIVGVLAQGILSIITGLISFVLFLTRADRKSLPDLIASTVVVHDPQKVLG